MRRCGRQWLNKRYNLHAAVQTWHEPRNRPAVPSGYAGIDTYAEQTVYDFELLSGEYFRICSRRAVTTPRLCGCRTVELLAFSGQGIQAAIWQHGYPTPRKWRGNPRGIPPLLAHDFRRKSSVLYLLSRLARERGGAVWRRHFPAPGNQAVGWSVAIIPPPDFERDKRYIKPPSLVLRPAAAAAMVSFISDPPGWM